MKIHHHNFSHYFWNRAVIMSPIFFSMLSFSTRSLTSAFNFQFVPTTTSTPMELSG